MKTDDKTFKFLKLIIDGFTEVYLTSNIKKFMKEFDKNQSEIGKILKCHLLIESKIDDLLIEKYYDTNINVNDLSFSLKLKLLPKEKIIYPNNYDAIFELNRIWNKIAHNDKPIEFNDIPNILSYINKLDKYDFEGKIQKPIDYIVIFSVFAYSFLDRQIIELKICKINITTNNNLIYL